MKISTKEHKSVRESGLAALAALTPKKLHSGGDDDYEAWPRTMATAAELTMCLSGCLRAAHTMDKDSQASFDVERVAGDSFLVTGTSVALASTACSMLDEAGFDVMQSGSIVLAKADKKGEKKSRGSSKVSSETKKKLVKTAARDMDVLKDAWSMKVAQRLFQEHVGAGDNFVAFMRFIDDLDNLMRKYRDQSNDDDDGDGETAANDDLDDGDPSEASAADKHPPLTEEAAEELANVLLELDKLYDAPMKFSVE